MDLIWLLVIILLVVAIFGGIGVSPWFWLLIILVVLLVVFRF